MNIYKSVVDQEEFSKIVAMKKFLGYTDADVEENFRSLIEEKQRTQLADWYAEKINSEGPAVIDSPLAVKGLKNTADVDPNSESEEKDESREGSESDESSEDKDESDTGSGEEEQEEEKSEPPAPTFGLG